MGWWMEIGDVVQFNEKHKWRGCLGIVEEMTSSGDDVRYLIGVPVPQQGTAYIFSMGSEREFDYIGKAVLVSGNKENEE